MAKKGHKGQKKLQGSKAKKALKAKKTKMAKGKVKANSRKTQSKAVKTNLKKMSFDNLKKIDVLNAGITKVLMAPSKASASSSKQKPQKKPILDDDQEMPDVGSIEKKLASM